MEVKRFGSPFFFNLLSMFFGLKESTTDSDSLKKAASQLVHPQSLCLGKSGSQPAICHLPLRKASSVGMPNIEGFTSLFLQCGQIIGLRVQQYQCF